MTYANLAAKSQFLAVSETLWDGRVQLRRRSFRAGTTPLNLQKPPRSTLIIATSGCTASRARLDHEGKLQRYQWLPAVTIGVNCKYNADIRDINRQTAVC